MLFPVPVGPEMDNRKVSTIISVLHLVGGPVKLVPAAVGSDEGPATGRILLPVALLPVPALVQPRSSG